MKKQVQAGWSGWRQESEVIFDKKVAAKVKGKIFKRAVRPAMFGLETVELLMLRWFGQVQRRNNEYIGRRMLKMELPSRRQRRRPKKKFMDVREREKL